MRQDSNAYIIGFATAVCLVCSIVVSTSAVALRERQDRNKVLDRQTQVLVVAGLLEEGQNVSPGNVESLFDEHIQIRVIAEPKNHIGERSFVRHLRFTIELEHGAIAKVVFLRFNLTERE